MDQLFQTECIEAFKITKDTSTFDGSSSDAVTKNSVEVSQNSEFKRPSYFAAIMIAIIIILIIGIITAFYHIIKMIKVKSKRDKRSSHLKSFESKSYEGSY